MNNLKQRIIESFRWKKHPRICAEKLNITEKQYVKLKREILQERKKERKEEKDKKKFFTNAEGKCQMVESIDLEKGEG